MTDSNRRLFIVACVSHAFNVFAQTALSLISTFSVESKEISFPHEKYQRINQILSILDAADVIACNHMSAVYYFTNSINSKRMLTAYPCANYASFDHGSCASCSVHGVPCQTLGYGASPNHVLGSLYLNTLSGLSAYNFGQ